MHDLIPAVSYVSLLRFGDINPNVRVECVKYSKYFLVYHPDLVKDTTSTCTLYVCVCVGVGGGVLEVMAKKMFQGLNFGTVEPTGSFSTQSHQLPVCCMCWFAMLWVLWESLLCKRSEQV